MEKFHTNTVVIGAGVVGLAIAKEISSKDPEIIILEKEARIGQITSSRNSGVIHAGMYYPSHTLKAKLCVEGNRLLYAYAKKFNVPFENTKKIIVANNQSQMIQKSHYPWGIHTMCQLEVTYPVGEFEEV